MRQCPICGNYFNEIGQICSACYAQECNLRAINATAGEHVVPEKAAISTATETLGTSVFAGIVSKVSSTFVGIPISGSGSVFERLNQPPKSVSTTGSGFVQAPKHFGTTSPLKTDAPMFSISEGNPFSSIVQPAQSDTWQRSTSGAFDGLFSKDVDTHQDIPATPPKSVFDSSKMDGVAPAATDEAEATAPSSAPVVPTPPKSVFDSSKMDGVAPAPTDEAELTASSSEPVVPTSPKSVFDSSRMDGVTPVSTDEAELTASSSAPVVPTSPKSVSDSSKMDGVTPAPTDEAELTASSSEPVVPTSQKSVFDSSKMDGVTPVSTDEAELTALSSAPVVPTSPKSVFDSSKMDGVTPVSTDEAELTALSSAPVVPTSPKSVFDSSKMDGVAPVSTDEVETEDSKPPNKNSDLSRPNEPIPVKPMVSRFSETDLAFILDDQDLMDASYARDEILDDSMDVDMVESTTSVQEDCWNENNMMDDDEAVPSVQNDTTQNPMDTF